MQLTLANFNKYRASKDQRVRRETVDAFFAALKKYEDISGATLAAEFKRDVFMARARGYSPVRGRLPGSREHPGLVAENLVASVHRT